MENVAEAIAQHLVDRYRVEVVTTSVGAGRAPRTEDRSGVHVRRFRGWTVAHTPISPGLLFRLLMIPRNSVIHAHLTHAFLPEAIWLTSKLRRRPYIAHFHLDVDPSGPFGFLLRHYKRLIFGPVMRGASRVIALSADQATFLATAYGVSRCRLRVVPNGVSDRFFALARTPREQNAPGPLRLLFVGRLDQQKNVQRLLDAMATLVGVAELVVVGDGEDRERLTTFVGDAGLGHVRFVGTQRGEDLERWFRWADAFVLTSDREGMSISLLEGMAAGLPIVATRVPGTVELLDGIGMLVEPSAEAVAAGIGRLAGDHDLRTALAGRSRLAGKEMSWPRRIDQLDDLYRNLWSPPC